MPRADRDRLPFNPPGLTRACVLGSTAPCALMWSTNRLPWRPHGMALCRHATPGAAWILAPGAARLQALYRCGAQARAVRRSTGFRAVTEPRRPPWQGGIDRQSIQAIQRPIGLENHAEAERNMQSARSIRARRLFTPTRHLPRLRLFGPECDCRRETLPYPALGLAGYRPRSCRQP